MSSQFFLKTSKDIELFQGYPDFTQSNSAANAKDDQVISSVLSPCGRFFAISTKGNVKVFSGELLEVELLNLTINDVYEIQFSPSGNYMSTWERPSAKDAEHKNVKVWYLNKVFTEAEEQEPVFQYQHKPQNGWFMQFSKLDDYALKMFKNEIRIVKINDTNKTNFHFDQPFATLSKTQENDSQPFSTYQVSPADFPTICTFTPEKGGKPAQLSIWSITEGKITKKIASKTFFKADSCQLQWNPQGNAVLCVATTDFDSTNKSYYGENTLYLLSFQGVNGAVGNNSVRVSLAKGPVHDISWSPTSRQFGVISGYMPATIQFFDLRGNVVHSLEKQPKNTILFSPSGRYILIAGFGNLQGSVQILDCHDKFKSLTVFNAANTSVCKWSPGGEFIMTATTSPRLRVDNCIKIWHVSGTLVFAKEFEELLKVDWRNTCKYKTLKDHPHVIKDWTPLNNTDAASLDPQIANPKKDLAIHESAKEYEAKHPKRDAKTGNGSTQSKSASTGGAYKPPHARRAAAVANNRSVPGASPKVQRAIPGLIPGLPVNEGSAAANKNRKRRANKKANSGTGEGAEKAESPAAPSITSTEPAKEASPEEKKIRSLLKKLRAIEMLKEKQAAGEKLQDLQVKKIETEGKFREELAALGWKEE
ncbi:Eukaryotic translation initiation factor eIF2A [Nakaseomyces glabratus]